jgi:polyisoprenoid-binding protein YceI
VARFRQKDRFSITFDKAGKTGKVDISIDASSVNSGTAAFDKHLQSADLFDVPPSTPPSTSSGDKFTFDGDKVTAVAGNLTLLGKTAPVTLKANQFATATKAPCSSVKCAVATLKPPSTAACSA